MIVPDKVGYEIVHRGWRVDWKAHLNDPPLLRSLSMTQFSWKPGEKAMAKCLAGPKREKLLEWELVDSEMNWDGAVYVPEYKSWINPPDAEPPPGKRWKPSVKWALQEHEAPQRSCRCGLYGLVRPHWGMILGYAFSGDGPIVLGTAKVWGKIIPGTNGSRAQYGYPHELSISPYGDPPGTNNVRLATALSDAYGVPVTHGEPPTN